jgi:cysteine-rich repeat protein
LRFGAYHCESDDACRSRGEQGVCEVTGFCSYPEPDCDSGSRYDEFAGALAGQCVEPDGQGTGTGTGVVESTGPPPTSTGSESSGAASDSTGMPVPTCGDAIVDPGEDCDDGNDLDGDGCNADCTASGTVVWDVVHPELGSVARGVAVGGDGSVAVAGGRIESGQSDVLLLVFDADGVAQWQRVHAGADGATDEGRQVAFDDRGNVYVTGYETVVSTMPPQGENVWTRVYDPLGAAGWTRGLNGPNDDDDRAFDVFWYGGRVVVAGYYNGSTDTWLRAYDDADGGVAWSFGAGVDPLLDDYANALVVGDDGVYCVGDVINPAGDTDAWLARLSIDGQQVALEWVEIVDPGEPADDTALGIARAADGGLVVGGRRGGRAWLAKYTAAGALEWERYDDALQSPTDVRGVAVDAAGQIVAVGYETDPVQGEDAFVTKRDPDGEMLWSRRYDGPAGGTDRARAVDVGPDRGIVVAGFTDAADGRRLWLRKYTP